MNNFNWDAASFFERLTARNRLARDSGYRFCRVASLEGFHGALTDMYDTPAFVAISDETEGYTDIDNTPHTRRVKLVFLAMRHAADRMDLREKALDNMRELFRQFMSVLIREKTQLEEGRIYLDERIRFKEMDKYFFTGCACAYFQIAVDTYTNLEYNPGEWTDE